MLVSKPKIRASAQSLARALMPYGVSLDDLAPAADGWHTAESILQALRDRVRASAPRTVQPQPIAASAAQPQPWGDGDPIEWAVRTGRLVAASAGEWRADLQHNRTDTEHWLSRLAPANWLATEAVNAGSTVPTGARRPGAAYAVNPLAEQSSRIAASATSAMPTLFASGDIPPLTASGFPPERLLDLPWQARHAAAAESDGAKALEIFERYAANPDEAAIDFAGHHGNVDYQARHQEFRQVNMTVDEAYADLYGQDALQSAKTAEAEDRAQRRRVAERQLDAIDAEEPTSIAASVRYAENVLRARAIEPEDEA